MSAGVALVMAGGTGGHIFPGLAVAQGLRERGWRVHWLGAPAPSMESRLVPPQGFAFEAVQFSGVRGKGLASWITLPMKLLQAFWHSLQVVRRVRPDVVVGLGGYISFPGGMMGVLCGRPLVLHEQNSIAGMANRWLSRVAARVFCAFPGAIARGEWIGNPLRASFAQQAAPAMRFAQRSGPLRVLVLGGSLGAQALNEALPAALARMPESLRPQVLHQSGERHIDSLRQAYAQAGVPAELTPFIDDTAHAMAQADVVITTALIPGRAAPVLVTEEMVKSMKAGSVIVDLAAGKGPAAPDGSVGGNCPLTETDRTVVKHGVTLVGDTNLPALVAADASALYARNVLDFLKLVLGKDGGLQVDLTDDIVAACLGCLDAAD